MLQRQSKQADVAYLSRQKNRQRFRENDPVYTARVWSGNAGTVVAILKRRLAFPATRDGIRMSAVSAAPPV